jgi:hypothetical protein
VVTRAGARCPPVWRAMALCAAGACALITPTACGLSERRKVAVTPAPTPLVIQGNEWTYRDAKLHFMDRAERWEAALGPPSRKVDARGGFLAVWDDLGIAVRGPRSPDGRRYVQTVHLDLGDSANASPLRRANHESPIANVYPAQGYRGWWSWNGVPIPPGRVQVDDVRYAMRPSLYFKNTVGGEGFSDDALDPDAFKVHVSGSTACPPGSPGTNCPKYIDEIEFDGERAPIR